VRFRLPFHGYGRHSEARQEDDPRLFCLLYLQRGLSDGINQIFRQKEDFTTAWTFQEKGTTRIEIK
jgi:hypothetical protein